MAIYSAIREDMRKVVRTQQNGTIPPRTTIQPFDLSKDTQFYVQSLTTFYTRYPDARDIYIYEILELLGENLTLEEIYKHPFMRHKGPSKPTG